MGLFQKNGCGRQLRLIVNDIWNDYANQDGITLLWGAILFAFQIYGDFSGYSDIAIGTARLFGINLMRNFSFPYFSRDIAEFWRKWHISLTTWFRDYVYIPLGGSRCAKWKVMRNTMIIFLVSGVWHGANWTFVIWGLYHALLFFPLMLFGQNRKHTNIVANRNLLPSIKEFIQMAITFFPGGYWMDYIPCGKHYASLGLYIQNGYRVSYSLCSLRKESRIIHFCAIDC